MVRARGGCNTPQMTTTTNPPLPQQVEVMAVVPSARPLGFLAMAGAVFLGMWAFAITAAIVMLLFGAVLVNQVAG